MAIKVYIKQGAGSASVLDVTPYTPMWQGTSTPLLNVGMRYGSGQASQSTFELDRPVAGPPPYITSPAYFAGRRQITATEGVTGCERWLFRGRGIRSSQGRGIQTGNRASEQHNTAEDGNGEVRGLPFTEVWSRPEETDYDRLVALQAYILNGADSTAPHHRDTTLIVVDDAHLCKDANTVMMPATDYPGRTGPDDVIRDCATTAGKDWGIVIHEGGYPPTVEAAILDWDWTGCTNPTNTYPTACTSLLPPNGWVWGETVGVTTDPRGVGTPGCTAGLDHDPGSAAFPVIPGSAISAIGSFARYNDYVCLVIEFFNSSCVPSGGDILSSDVALSYTSFTDVTASGMVPAGAAYARVHAYTDHTRVAGFTGTVNHLVVNGAVTAESQGICDHLCLQYIVPTDLSTNPCTVKISDDPADYDPLASPPVTEPIPIGDYSVGENQDMAFEVFYEYQTPAGSGSTFAENSGYTNHDYYGIAVSDNESLTPAQALLRAGVYLNSVDLVQITNTLEILLNPDQVHLVRAGMAIQLKGRAITSDAGLPLPYVTRRIAQVQLTPIVANGSYVYKAQLEIDRPSRLVPQPSSYGPNPGDPSRATVTDPATGGTSTVQGALNDIAPTTIKNLTNKSGGSVAAGDVVIIDTANDDSFTTTTTAGVTKIVGVAQATIANNASGPVALEGYVALVNITGSVTRGDYGFTSTTVKKASNSASRSAGAFCQFTKGGTTPDAILFGVPDLGGAGVTYGTPAVVLGTSAAAGSINEAIRRDSTIVAFDATAPTTQAFGDSAAAGSAGVASRRDHKHAWPTAAVTTSGLTQATGKLLGRSSASTGAIEEITIGTNLTLSGGTLDASGGGGGGGTNAPDGKPWNFTPPASANTIDDEFGDAASQSGPVNGLNAKWSKHNLGTSGWLVFSDTKAPGCVLFKIPGGQAADQHIYQSFSPAGDFTVACRFMWSPGMDRQMWFINALDTSGNGVGVGLDQGDQPRGRQISSWQQTGTSWALGIGDQGQAITYAGLPFTFFLRRVSGNYSGSMTVSDRFLDPTYTAFSPSAFTLAYITFGRIYGGGNDSSVALDFFRRIV